MKLQRIITVEARANLPYRNRLRWAARLSLLLAGILTIYALEMLLRHFGVAQVSEDPFMGFAGSHHVFEKARSPEGPIYRTSQDKLRYFDGQIFLVEKSPETYRIFVLGGSVVMGFPFGDTGSFPRFLEKGLEAINPEYNYEVINAGGFGYASYRVRRVLGEILNYDPDLIIIMSGHNEFLEKRVYGDWSTRSKILTSSQESLDNLRLYRVLRSAIFTVRGDDARPVLSDEIAWEHMFRDKEQREYVLKHYRSNIIDMAHMCLKQEVPLVMLTLPCNLKDFPPFRSAHRPSLAPEQLKIWEESYYAGLQAFKDWNWDLALAQFNMAGAIDSDYAGYHYYRGRILLYVQHEDEAVKWLWGSVRRDAWPVRAFRQMNEDILRLSRAGVTIVDAQRSFSGVSAQGIPGDEMFLDHCHPTLEGQQIIARELAQTLVETGFVSPGPRWQSKFDRTVESYTASLSDGFMAEAYYRVAFETGINMGRTERGLRLARMVYDLNPNHPKVFMLIDRLK